MAHVSCPSCKEYVDLLKNPKEENPEAADGDLWKAFGTGSRLFTAFSLPRQKGQKKPKVKWMMKSTGGLQKLRLPWPNWFDMKMGQLAATPRVGVMMSSPGNTN